MDDKEYETIQRRLRTLRRLGITFGAPGVDPENVPVFAKTIRMVGLIAMTAFILWGLLYDWSYRHGPFFELFRSLGIDPWNDEQMDFWLLTLSGTLAFIGWYFRFFIGVAICTGAFGLFGLLSKVFRSV